MQNYSKEILFKHENRYQKGTQNTNWKMLVDPLEDSFLPKRTNQQEGVKEKVGVVWIIRQHHWVRTCLHKSRQCDGTDLFQKKEVNARSSHKIKSRARPDGQYSTSDTGTKYGFTSNWLRTQDQFLERVVRSGLLRELATTRKTSLQTSSEPCHVAKLTGNRIYASPRAVAVQKTSSRSLHTTEFAGKKIYAWTQQRRKSRKVQSAYTHPQSLPNAIPAWTLPLLPRVERFRSNP